MTVGGSGCGCRSWILAALLASVAVSASTSGCGSGDAKTHGPDAVADAAVEATPDATPDVPDAGLDPAPDGSPDLVADAPADAGEDTGDEPGSDQGGDPAGEPGPEPGPDDGAEQSPDDAPDSGPGPDAEADTGPADDQGAEADPGPAEDQGAEADAGGEPEEPVSPFFGLVVFNEVLTDGTAEGDPNGDGDANPVEDQFVELVNVSGQAVPMAGFALVEQDLAALPRHTFAAGFVLAAGRAVVVFGGGDAPPATSSATFFAANAADPGIPFGLHLSPQADSMDLFDADGLLVARFCYGGADACAIAPAGDQSLTRAPDLTGEFVPHTEAAGAEGAAFSPGTRLDGTPFP